MKQWPVALAVLLLFGPGVESASVDHKAEEEELNDNDDDEEAHREQLLAERDDLKAQLATKNREFLEQHRKADRLLHQLHNQRQVEKTEHLALARARESLARISAEAAREGASAAAETPTTAAPTAAPKESAQSRSTPGESSESEQGAHVVAPSQASHPQVALRRQPVMQHSGAVVSKSSAHRAVGTAPLAASVDSSVRESDVSKSSASEVVPSGPISDVELDTAGFVGEAALSPAQAAAQRAPQQPEKQEAKPRQEVNSEQDEENTRANQGRSSTEFAQFDKLRKERDEAQQQVNAMTKTLADEQRKEQRDLQDMRQTAAAKLHAVEQKVQSMTAELRREKQAEAQAVNDVAKAKDTLMQETGQSLQAAQRVESLGAELAEANKAAAQNGKQVTMLSEQVAVLQKEKAHAQDVVKQMQVKDAELHSKMYALQTAFKRADHQAKQAANESQKLHDQLAEVSVDAQRADALQEQVRTLSTAAAANTTKERDLEEQMQRVRQLKDHYSSELEVAQNQSDTWQAKAEDLDRKLLESEREETAVARQRDAAIDRVRQARSEADEYYEENNKLQQQNQDLESQLKERLSQSNTNQAEVDALKVEVKQLRDEDAKEKATSHAAFMRSEDEISKVKKDTRDADAIKVRTEDQVMRIQQVLTDEQRKKLGLPPAPKFVKEPVKTSLLVPGQAAHASRGVPTKHHVAPLLRGESHGEDVRQTWAAKMPTPRSSPSTRTSALQKLAAYFASPLQQH